MELTVGGIFTGKVTGITKYGAFVNFEGGKSGLIHISEISSNYVSDVSKHVQMGQMIRVKVLSINDDGKINLSLKQVESEEAAPAAEKSPKSAAPAARKPEKYVMAPAQTVNESSGDLNFEDRLKKFMQESDSRIADSRRYTERKQRGRKR